MAWTFSQGAFVGNSPCWKCRFVDNLFSFTGSALLAAAPVLVVIVSSLLVRTRWWTALAAH